MYVCSFIAFFPCSVGIYLFCVIEDYAVTMQKVQLCNSLVDKNLILDIQASSKNSLVLLVKTITVIAGLWNAPDRKLHILNLK